QRLRQLLLEEGAAEASEVEQIEAEVDEAVADAQAFAEAAAWPQAADATTHVYAEPLPPPRPPPAATRATAFMQATLEVLGEEMERNPRIFVLGEGIGKRGGNFRTTVGLYDRFGPGRLCDTPISERGFTGVACGAAMTGTRPVVDFMFADFALDAVAEIVNQIAKMQYMSSRRL